jgi:hypothetical protein
MGQTPAIVGFHDAMVRIGGTVLAQARSHMISSLNRQ